MDELTVEEKDKIIERKLAELMEHFDSVHIFVTKHNTQTQITEGINKSGGNYYTRMGQITEYMQDQSAPTVMYSIAESLDENEEDE